MRIPVWVPIAISIATLVVGTIVTLSVAALNRKQQRQIELHRADPTVPLVPPAHPITRFLKTHGAFIIGVGLNLGLLIKELRQTGPITRYQVFSIALLTSTVVGLILFQITAQLIMSVSSRVMDLSNRQIDAVMRMFDNIVDYLRGTSRPE
jgi:hypothetical protein